MARSPRKTRNFKPSKKSSRRTTDSPKARAKTRADQPEGELEVLESVEEKRSMQIESVIVLITAIGLVLGLYWSMRALGRHYAAGPFKGLYEKPDKTLYKDPGVGAMRLRVVEKEG